jgi:hypothetical protein
MATDNAINRSEFSAGGRVITLARNNIQVFEYDRAALATAEAEKFAEGYRQEATRNSWQKTVHLYARGSMLIFYMGDDEKILKALQANASPLVGGDAFDSEEIE